MLSFSVSILLQNTYFSLILLFNSKTYTVFTLSGELSMTIIIAFSTHCYIVIFDGYVALNTCKTEWWMWTIANGGTHDIVYNHWALRCFMDYFNVETLYIQYCVVIESTVNDATVMVLCHHFFLKVNHYQVVLAPRFFEMFLSVWLRLHHVCVVSKTKSPVLDSE